MLNLKQLKLVLLDMDGVLHRGGEILPGAAELTTVLDRLGLGYACLTNNSSQLPATFARHLQDLGVAIATEHVITSSTATATLLRTRYPQGTRVLAIGMDGIQSSLFADGYFVSAETDVAAVVVGVDFNLTYARLKTATLALRAGAAFIATNSDRTFPAPEGLIPGAGSIVAALAAASDCPPEVIGKPEPAMFEAALQLFGVTAEQTLMVGDRLDTDIAGAQRVGIATAFVGSGVHSMQQAQAWQPAIDLVADDLAGILALLRAGRE
ncbi:MAG: HAD-IIA family hydrolase [Chloroflexi bacterium]|nr:HAD-IIA family hydrolase [Chloroflexota bacterium]